MDKNAEAKLLRRYILRDIPANFKSIRIDRHAIRLRDLDIETEDDSRHHEDVIHEIWDRGYLVATTDGASQSDDKRPLLRPLCGPRTDRFFAGAPAPTFQALIKSFYDFGGSVIAGPEQGRRIFALLAERGIGRGQFFAALGGTRRIAELCDHLKLLRGQSPHDIHFVRLNLGLSHEILSIFDRLAEFLFRCLSLALPQEDIKVFRRGYVAYRDNRYERLRYVLQQCHEHEHLSASQFRAVISINHADVFYARDHTAKNAQARKLMELLLDTRFAKAPIDLFLLIDEEMLPGNFLPGFGGTSPHPDSVRLTFKHITPADHIEALKQETAARLQRLGLSEEDFDGGRDRAYLHVLRRMRPEVFALRFFPRAAMILTRMAMSESSQSVLDSKDFITSSRMRHLGTDRHIRWFQHSIRRLFEKNLKISPEKPYKPDTDYDTDTIARAGLVWSVLLDAALKNPTFSARYYASIESNLFEVQTGFPYPLMHYAVKHAEKIVADDAGIYTAMVTDGDGIDGSDIFDSFGQHVAINTTQKRADWLAAQSEAVKQKFQWIRNLVGRHRYGTTIVMAAIEDLLEVQRRLFLDRDESQGCATGRDLEHVRFEFDLALGQESWPTGQRIDDKAQYDQSAGIPPQEELFRKTVRATEDFLASLKVRTAGKSLERREDEAIDQVLILYRSQHCINNRWPFHPAMTFLHYGRMCDRQRWSKLEGAERKMAMRLDNLPGRLVSDTLELLLFHLSLIGQPVEAATLRVCPEIADALNAVAKQVVSDDVSEQDLKDHKFKRFAINALLDLLVHRCLVFRVRPKATQLKGIRYIEDRFAVHKSVRRYFYRRFDTPLVDYLDVDQLTVSLFATQPNDLPRPDMSAQQRIEKSIRTLIRFEGFEGQAQIDKEKIVRRQAADLRAANGILRSIYSIGVVCRFNAFHDDREPFPEKGYLESHRQLIRWMLRRAVALDERLGDSDKNKRPLAPLYEEEVAWLFNEAGVISVVQGKLNDANELLRQALATVKKGIEPHMGPLTNRIGLNLAICDIERGRARQANEVLEIIRDDKTEHPALRLIAEGYLGLIDHLRGDDVSARAIYGKVEHELSNMGRSRAASIFARHHADLLRALGRHHAASATEYVNRSIHHASNGAHEDIRNLAQVSKLKIRIANSDISTEAVEARLISIERYARIIGVPRLMYECAGVRALIMLRNGDARSAHAESFRSLNIANRYGMRLRTITSSLQLAQALAKIEPGSELQILQRASRMATEAQFHSARDSAESILGTRN